jgi:hypothetical protein
MRPIHVEDKPLLWEIAVTSLVGIGVTGLVVATTAWPKDGLSVRLVLGSLLAIAPIWVAQDLALIWRARQWSARSGFAAGAVLFTGIFAAMFGVRHSVPSWRSLSAAEWPCWCPSIFANSQNDRHPRAASLQADRT